MNSQRLTRCAWIVFAASLTGCTNGDTGKTSATAAQAEPAQPAQTMAQPAQNPSQAAKPASLAAAVSANTPQPASPEPTSPVPTHGSSITAHQNQGGQASLAKKEEDNLTTPPPALGGEQPQHNHGALAAAALAYQPHGDQQMVAALSHTPPASAGGNQASEIKKFQLQHYAALAKHFQTHILNIQHLTPNQQNQVLSLKAGDVGISNLDEVAGVNFAMKSGIGDWQDEYLKPQDSREFPCSFNNECLFWMQTGSNPAVYYKIQSSSRYVIVWDSNKGLWDLRLAQLDN